MSQRLNAIENNRLAIDLMALRQQIWERDGERTLEVDHSCEDYPRLKKCSVRLQPSNLFSQLLKQPAATWISPDRPSPIAGLIPGTFKQAAQSDHFFLMSVFNHRGAYGLFYADKGTHDRIGMSESEYKIFKIACRIAPQIVSNS